MSDERAVLIRSIDNWTPVLVRKYEYAAFDYMVALADALSTQPAAEEVEVRYHQCNPGCPGGCPDDGKEYQRAVGPWVAVAPLVGNSDEAISNRAEILSLVNNYQTRITEYAARGASRDALKSRVNELKREFIGQATVLGFPRDEVLKHAAAFNDFDLAIDRVSREPSGIGVVA